MLDGDAPRAFAAGARSEHEFTRPDGVGAGPGDAGKGRDIEDADGGDRVDDARTKDGGHHDGTQDGRKGEGEIGQPHDQFFHPAASRRRQQTQRRADRQADADRNHANQNRVARTDQQQRSNVPTEGVGAQPVLSAGHLELGGHVNFIGRPGRPHQRQRGGAQKQQGQHGANHKAAMVQGPRHETWGLVHMSLAFTRGSITAYSTSTMKLTTITIAASSMTQLRTTIRSRFEIAWKMRRPSPGR